MAYSATEFIFDGIPSGLYGLQIMNFDNNSQNDSSGLGDLKIETDRINRNPMTYLLDATYDKPLEFKLHFGSPIPIDRHKLSLIQRWLFGHKEYKKLQIVQDDLQNIYYNCILNKPKIITISNEIWYEL